MIWCNSGQVKIMCGTGYCHSNCICLILIQGPLLLYSRAVLKLSSFIYINCIDMGAETQTGADYEDLMKPFHQILL